MLRINLLPEDQQKTTLSPIEQFHRTPFMWIVLGIVVALPLFSLAPIAIRRQQLAKLNAKIDVLEPKKVAVDQLQRFLQTLRAQELAFQDVAKGQGLWAQRLNTLSDATPDGVWFTELTLDPTKGVLTIRGSAVGQTDPGAISVTRFVHSLKGDSNFIASLKDIQIESLKRVQDGEIEVMQFTLSCPLLEGASP